MSSKNVKDAKTSTVYSYMKTNECMLEQQKFYVREIKIP